MGFRQLRTVAAAVHYIVSKRGKCHGATPPIITLPGSIVMVTRYCLRGLGAGLYPQVTHATD